MQRVLGLERGRVARIAVGNPPYEGRESPLTGMFFVVRGNMPVVIAVDGEPCIPIFSCPEALVHAEEALQMPRGKMYEITNGDRFYDVYHHGFRIVLDPRVVDGAYAYDDVVVELAPKELS